MGAGLYFFKGFKKPFDGPTWEVEKKILQVTIVERGTLESAENSEIFCRVKGGSKIKWVIEDGTHVERGDVLMILEDSTFQDQLKTQLITVNNAMAGWKQAEQNCAIVESQNYSDLESAKVTRDLAVLALRKYLGAKIAAKTLEMKSRPELTKYLLTEFSQDLKAEEEELEELLKTSGGGDQKRSVSEFLQARSEIKGLLNDARSTQEQAEDRAAWSQRMVKKGYLSRSQAEADQARLDSAKNNFRKIQLQLEILHKYTLETTVTDLWSKVTEAERAIERVITQNRAKKIQAETDRDNKQAVYLQEESKRAEIEEEIRKCTIVSPQQGLVVYYVSETSRFGTGSSQAIIAQGEPVKEGQKLMRIPNLARMLVNTRVHEAMVSRLKGEVSKPTHFLDTLRAGLTVSRDPYDLLLKQAFFVLRQDDFRDWYKEEETPRITYPGQPAKIRIDAFPGMTLEGNVKSVANVASQSDFLSSDIKVYQTMVSIHGQVDNLKPGMSAEVTILAKATKEPVLVIPLQAVVGSVAMGAKRKCFVLDAEGQPQLRDIEVGLSNDTLVEVRSGLELKQKVVVNPRPLLGDKSDLRPASTPTGKRGSDWEDGGAAKKGKKGPASNDFDKKGKANWKKD